MADDKKAKKDDKPKEEKPKDAKDAKDTKGGKETEAKEGEEGAAEGAEAEAAPRFTPKKIILFIVLPLLVIIGCGTGAYYMGFLDKMLGKPPNCENVKEGDKNYEECSAQKVTQAGTGPGAFIDVPNMIVNLNSTTKKPNFLKISLKIELESAEEQKKFEPLLPRVIDQFQMYLRELRIDDLRGTSGIYRMKIELLNRVRAAAPDIKVRDVLFQEILIQ
jgi:flagellar FliL protein